MEKSITRRTSLLALGGLVAGALGWKAEAAESAGVGPAAVASGAVICVLTPELTEGPYYVAGEKVRSNITEGRPGTKLALALTVVDASTCKPIRGANVDIWHRACIARSPRRNAYLHVCGQGQQRSERRLHEQPKRVGQRPVDAREATSIEELP